jgi:hypothetical protein
MTLLCADALTTVLDALAQRSSWKLAAESVGGTEALMFQWLSKSRLAADRKDVASPFMTTWQDRTDWWHSLARSARAQSLIRLDGLVRSQCADGILELMFDGSGAPVWATDPKIASDAMSMEDWEWEATYGSRNRSDVFQRDATGALVQQQKLTQVPAVLKIKALEQISSYRPTTNLNVHQRSESVVRITGDANSPAIAQRQLPQSIQQQLDTIVAQKKAEAALHLADPSRVTKPSHPVATNGAPTHWPDTDRRGRTTTGGAQGFSMSRG